MEERCTEQSGAIMTEHGEPLFTPYVPGWVPPSGGAYVTNLNRYHRLPATILLEPLRREHHFAAGRHHLGTIRLCRTLGVGPYLWEQN